MSHIQVLNPITYQGWNDLIISNKLFSFFHSKSWAQVICESYNYKPFYFLLSDKNRKIAKKAAEACSRLLDRGCIPYMKKLLLKYNKNGTAFNMLSKFIQRIERNSP